MPRIPPALRLAVIDRAQRRCEYCQVPQEAELVEYEVDHITAGQHGGETTLDNLAYACFDCNHYKGPNLASLDPQTGERTWLFNPRLHTWEEHFHLDGGGTIVPQTPEGRATARLLCFNLPSRVLQRSYTIAAENSVRLLSKFRSPGETVSNGAEKEFGGSVLLDEGSLL